ncbi:DUF5709 domain-containing protein [Streptosporangium sp. NBC_01755]|uniref:DUF5709 domain-containing protein n=1 Tax=unclassified Streptosporangium TaxID=2632669 RepID=UPI002DD9C72D|nr:MULTISPECIES: DUF5709 domain-containing protein [unclassified Streptosporangium]WSA27254.1 DUF5709 domain-containing protein [Streptosporangium sp. NBC_01810]WSD01193.1 DUF5709 domain-containing protein [Streptosporangium sp. NBC_01755]
MTEKPPDREGLSDEQAIEVEEWTDDLGLHHEILPNDPEHHDTLDERLWREAPNHERVPREENRLVAPDEGIGPDETAEEYARDVGPDSGDLSAEERAIHIEPD